MATEADEHERALALEMTFQRRQWDKMQKLEKSVSEHASGLKELERRFHEQEERANCLELQLETHHRELHTSTLSLTERWTEERDARQRELLDLRVHLKSLDGKCEDVVREAKNDLSLATQKGLQELLTSTEAMRGVVRALQQGQHDLQASGEALQRRHEESQAAGEALQWRHEEMEREHLMRFGELERVLAEERAGRLEEQQRCLVSLASLQSAHEGAQHATARCCEEQRIERQDLRGAIAALDCRCGDVLRDTTKELSQLVHTKHQDLSTWMDSRHQECVDLVRDFGSRLTDLAHEAAQHHNTCQQELQGLRGSLGEVERRCGDHLHKLLDELGEQQLVAKSEVVKRCGTALRELAARLDSVEYSLASHTHQFTSTKIYKCGLAMTPSTHDLTSERLRLPLEPLTPPRSLGGCHGAGPHQQEEPSTISTVAGSEP
eukprot:CAMPEP_0171100736 /NCGR_PEP_ID=MMETSP0766_2-20121228/53132_1 /TAXON_ID=439317 /ORGANISM="Gambierdiscus australes, Strain CAWD 149" /LENGTH=436 /DNA_ID=CAMNT_0011560609 /DNA_START=39 /DNA_END=1349 /DNA_ORIENTATION=-